MSDDDDDEYYSGSGGVEPGTTRKNEQQLILDGEELEEYCQKHGLCHLCAQTRTHKRVFRLKKKNQWQPMTVENKDDGEYIVYKGYCVQPGCFTLEQAQRLLGEIAPDPVMEDTEAQVPAPDADAVLRSTPKVRSAAQDPEAAFIEGQNEEPRGKQRKGISRLLLGRGGGGKKKKNNGTTDTGVAFSAGSFDGMTGFSAAPKKGGSRSRTGSSSSSTISGSKSSIPVKSEIRRDDDDVSVASNYTSMTSASNVRMSLAQLLQQNAGSMLDLSSTRLHHNHITELVNALTVASSLETLILENCKLNDNEIEILGNGLAGDNMVAPIKRLSFRSNRMGNRGAVSLQAWFRETSTLEELDMSKNQIGSRGAAATLHAFRDNPNCRLRMLNFAHNEIWDPDDGTFFASNKTLELINLEGNFIHDEGIEAIAKGIQSNQEGCVLRRLFLGWNGIGDEGCVQLSRMLETNTSLTTLGLGENDITSVGARALLSSLAANGTVREITGLYHNQIDRKFIVAAIKRLLQSHIEAVDGKDLCTKDPTSQAFEDSMSAMDTLAEPLGSALPPPEEMSEGSLDWADKLFASGQEGKIIPMAERNDPGVPLGTFDKKMEHGPDCTCETCQAATSRKEEAPASSSRPPPVTRAPPTLTTTNRPGPKPFEFQPMPEPQTTFDRVMVFQSAPLAYFNRETSLHHAVPLHDFEHERHALSKALESAEKLGATIDLEIEPGYPDRVRTYFDRGTSRVLHLSGYGHPEHLAFENGAGYIETMAPEELRNLVKAQSTGPCPLKLVVVNSFHSGRIGKAFVEAGVPHVVCCHHTEIFRDKAATGFIRNLYRGLAANKSLKQAFHTAQESVRVEEISKHVDRYVLLPQKPEDDPYHDVPIFYTDVIPLEGIRDGDMEDEDSRPNILPSLPKHFIGREVDIYEVLEALRVDDVVRIGGPKGSGKSSLVAATCRYVDQRRKMFQYDKVFWLPAAHGVIPEEDTLFGDLCELINRMMKGGDMFEDEETMEISDRIQIELEGTRALIAIDSRKFTADVAAENLELFLGELFNKPEINVKVLLISPSSEGGEEEIEEDTIRLKPIDFTSTALLFGEVSRFITANGCPAAQAPDEFAALMVPPSVAKIQDQAKFSSSRRTHLMEQMGNGNPLDVIKAGKNMPASAFIQLIGMANTPEVQIDSYKSLEAALQRWTNQRDMAVKSKNYLRATDLDNVLEEIQALRPDFPSLQDLMAKEQELQRKLNLAMSKKQYAAGNSIKREILTLKKVIMQEKRASNASQMAKDQIEQLQRQMTSIMKFAHSSFTDMDNLVTPEVSAAAFSLGSAYHHCEVAIYPGSVVHFDPGNDLGAIICWTNECCDMPLHDNGRELIDYGGSSLARDIGSLPGITRTKWGLAKCGTGNAVIVGPGNYQDLQVHCVILAVGPLSAAGEDKMGAEDEDALHYVKIMMRSCIRSALILAKHSQVQSVAFPTLTSAKGGETYEQTLLMGLKILVEEAKHSDLNNLHIVAKDEEESTKLIAMAIDMGLTMN